MQGIVSTSPIINQSDIIAKIILILNGNIVNVNGSLGTGGVIASYTPAAGKLFVFLRGHACIITDVATTSHLITIRNNTVIKDNLVLAGSGMPYDAIEYDSLSGTGAATYDMNHATAPDSAVVYATFSGVIW